MDNETMDNDYYSDGLYRHKTLGGKIFGWIGTAIVALVLGLIFFRIYIKNDPAEALTFLWTKETVSAYNESGDSFKVYAQTIHSYNFPLGKDEHGQMQYERITYNDITSDGCFKISGLVYIPDTKELQVTVRYNRLAVDHLKEAYHLTALPAGDPFFFALEGVGENGDEYATDYQYTPYARFTYEYRRLVFKNVDLTDASVVSLNAYYQGDVTLENPFTFDKVSATLPIYDSHLEWEDVVLKDILPSAESTLITPPYIPINKGE